MPSATALLATVALAVAATAAVAAPAAADPRKCFVVTGPDGQPINTTCIPWPVEQTD